MALAPVILEVGRARFLGGVPIFLFCWFKFVMALSTFWSAQFQLGVFFC